MIPWRRRIMPCDRTISEQVSSISIAETRHQHNIRWFWVFRFVTAKILARKFSEFVIINAWCYSFGSLFLFIIMWHSMAIKCGMIENYLIRMIKWSFGWANYFFIDEGEINSIIPQINVLMRMNFFIWIFWILLSPYNIPIR